MSKPKIRLVLTDGRGTGTGSAMVEVYSNRAQLLATVEVIIEPEPGADGKNYPTAKLLTDFEDATRL